MMRSFLLFLIWTSSIAGQAQEYEDAPRPDSLVHILNQMERRFDVRFSYVDEVTRVAVEGFDPADCSDLITCLHQLQSLSKLRYEKVNSAYVVVRPFEQEDEVTICGEVMDLEGVPMFGVLVRTDDGKGTVTGLDGYFELTISYGKVLNFQHVGYMTKRRAAFELLSSGCATLTMREHISVLEELTIHDYLTVGISKNQNQVEISPKELTVLPGLIEPDILQSIQQTPGVSSPYETASGIHVRGGAPDQNLVLWNGIKTYNQGHFFGMLSAFNPYITENVKFVKNGTSAAYGGRVSSVIDIKTDENVVDGISGGAGFNMLYGDLYMKAPLIQDKLSVLVSGRRSFTDVWQSPTYHQYSKRVFQNTKLEESASSNVPADNNFYFNDFNTSVVFQPDKENKLVLNTLYYKNDLDFSSRDEAGQEYHDDLLTQNEGYSLKWQMNNPTGFEMSQSAYYANYLLSYQFSNVHNDTTETSSKKNLITDVGYNLDLVFPIRGVDRLLAGYQLSNNHTRYAFEDFAPSYSIVLDQDDREILTHAAYAEYKLDAGKLEASVGFRGNYYVELDKFYPEPRLYAQYQVIKPLYVSASAEYRSQVVSQIKESVVSDLSLENQVWKLATKDRFPVIDSYQYTSGFVFAKNNWYLDVEGYLKKINGVTSLTFGFLNPVDNDYRIGNSEIKGVDFFLKRQVQNYKSWVAYSYIHTQNTFVGLNNDRPFPGNWNIEHQVNWSHFYRVGDLEMSLGWMWHTGKSYTDVIEQQSEEGPVVVGYDEINGNNLPVYHRLDFSAVYNFRVGADSRLRYRIGLSVLNVYNRKNLLNREFRTTPSLDNELIDTRVYSLGITPNLVFRVFW